MTSAPSPERETEAVAAEESPPASDSAAAEPASETEPSPEAQGSSEGERVSDDLDELEQVARERDEYLELAKRARADFENYRKRAAREAADAGTRAKASLAAELLPAIDNLERALQSSGIKPDAAPEAVEEPPSREVSGQEAFARGVELVLGEMQAALGRAGVEAYDPVGQQFDPNFSEALSTQAVEGTGSGVVVETLERGYRLDGQVIRPARVVVAE